MDLKRTHLIDERLELLISKDEIEQRVQEMSREILASGPVKSLLLIGILKGSLYFLADLSRHLPPAYSIDFLQVSSYRGGKSSSGFIQLYKDINTDIRGRNVLIVEDIVDTGETLAKILDLLAAREPKSLRVATLLSKRKAKGIKMAIDFVGFEIPDEFVVGYGLDFAERYRGAPDISILRHSESLL